MDNNDTKLPDSQMTLYGFRTIFKSAFFNSKEKLENYVNSNNNIDDILLLKFGYMFNKTCTIEYLGHLNGRSDVIKLTYENEEPLICTVIDEDGYAIYKRDNHWEYNYGNISDLYDAFRDRGIVFEEDRYLKMWERYTAVAELLENKDGSITLKIKNKNNDEK